MTDELKFTPEYIAKCRKANGGVWVFPETRSALDELETLHKQLAERDALIEQLIDACGGRWDQRLRDETKWLKCLRIYNKQKETK